MLNSNLILLIFDIFSNNIIELRLESFKSVCPNTPTYYEEMKMLM